MDKIKVLIADDSVVYRSQIRGAVSHISRTEVVGAVANGRLAIECLKQGGVDLLILDLEMPEMDGLATLAEIAKYKILVKILVFSSASKRGAEITLNALRLGASDFVAKPGAQDVAHAPVIDPADRIKNLLEEKIHALFPISEKATHKTESIQKSQTVSHTNVIWDIFNPSVVVIGSSTGGPSTLESIFSHLQGELKVPVFITQHMPPVFTAAFAERLARVSNLQVKEAQDGDRVEVNKVYVAPGDHHMMVEGSLIHPIIKLNKGPLVHSVRPAVDPLFMSVANIYKHKCLGIVLTGMGADGRDGALAIKKMNGAVIIQSKETCTVFGMPGAVYESKAYDKIAAPQEIASLLIDKIVMPSILFRSTGSQGSH